MLAILVNSERKKISTSSQPPLACVLLLLAVFWCHLVNFPSVKLILPYFSSLSMVAISVSFPEVRNRKETESGLAHGPFQNCVLVSDSANYFSLTFEIYHIQKVLWPCILQMHLIHQQVLQKNIFLCFLLLILYSTKPPFDDSPTSISRFQ